MEVSSRFRYLEVGLYLPGCSVGPLKVMWDAGQSFLAKPALNISGQRGPWSFLIKQHRTMASRNTSLGAVSLLFITTAAVTLLLPPHFQPCVTCLQVLLLVTRS